jgi:hypothetical protein|tara:strand:- start:637 stop:846 length:210 start_codon:yes stop_codon:yes gene_type:complete
MYYRTKVYINAELLATGSSTNEQESITIAHDSIPLEIRDYILKKDLIFKTQLMNGEETFIETPVIRVRQ